MPRAFLLPAHWADDLVAGIQALEHRVETLLIELQAALVLGNNGLFCNNSKTRSGNKAARVKLVVDGGRGSL